MYPYYQNYQNYPYQQSYQSPYVPQRQQVIQVNGKASVDTIQLAPNSSVLVMDTSAPIVWLCVSDGVGKVTSTPYDIVVHQDEPPADLTSIDTRLKKVETALERLNKNEQSNTPKPNKKSIIPNSEAD